MSFRLGLFDVFAYAIPGAGYAAIILYLAVALGWLSPSAILSIGAPVGIIVGLGVSYVLGQLSYGVGRFLVRALPGNNFSFEGVRSEFVRRHPRAAGRPFLRADVFLLLAAIEAHDLELAAEVTRLRTTGIMLRNLAAPLAAATAISIVQAFTGDTLPAVLAAFLFAASTVAAIQSGRERTNWAKLKTFEIAFWLDDIDSKLTRAL